MILITFRPQDILETMDQCNFEKSTGPDGFDSRILKQDPDIKKKVAWDIANLSMEGNLPNHLRGARLVPLTKIKG